MPKVLENEEDSSSAERALLEAALEFYGAAEAVIDYRGPSRPQLRYDAGGLKAVRDAMATLEQHVRAAHASGVSAEQIARITRLEHDIVALILTRCQEAASPDAAES